VGRSAARPPRPGRALERRTLGRDGRRLRPADRHHPAGRRARHLGSGRRRLGQRRHIAYVESVGDDYFVVSEMHAPDLGVVTERRVPIATIADGGVAFIY
jgi:hypothetical protein